MMGGVNTTKLSFQKLTTKLAFAFIIDNPPSIYAGHFLEITYSARDLDSYFSERATVH